MQAAVLQRSLHLGDLLGGAVGNFGAKVGDGDSAILIALAPVLRDVAGLRTLEQLLVVDLPDVGRGGQGSGGGGVEHVDVVADGVADLAGVLQLLGGSGGTGGVSVLADDDRTVGDQCLGGSALLVDVEPGVRVHDLHLDIGVNALDAQEEGGVAGDDLGVVVGADVADLDLAVSGEAVGLGLGGQGAGLDQLLDLHACDDTGDIAALVDGGKGVVEVIEAGNGGEVAGHGHKVDVRVLLGFLLHVGLMAVGVGDDQVAALADKVLGCVGGDAALSDLVLPDDLVIGHAQLGGSFLDAVDVRGAVAFGLVAQNDSTDLDVGGLVVAAALCSSGGTGGAAGSSVSGGTTGGQAEHHRGGQQNAHQFLHVYCSSLLCVQKNGKNASLRAGICRELTHFAALQDPL